MHLEEKRWKKLNSGIKTTELIKPGDDGQRQQAAIISVEQVRVVNELTSASLPTPPPCLTPSPPPGLPALPRSGDYIRLQPAQSARITNTFKPSQIRRAARQTKRTSFSHVNPLTPVSMKIYSGPLFLIDEIRWLPFNGYNAIFHTLSAQSWVNRDRGVMSNLEIYVNIIPEYPIPKTTFTSQDSRNLSSSVVNLGSLLRIPSIYIRIQQRPWRMHSSPTKPWRRTSSEQSERVRAALLQAVIATASLLTAMVVPSSLCRLALLPDAAYLCDGAGTIRSSPEYRLGLQLEGLVFVIDWINNATFFKSSPK
ncbi:hypothetical protein M378DRAFT_16808 [Amanita muscaria Koide BX008]|uniref:Uncharacterized protein n=1 Tax=Amanita muscaria (strain Koide BX008) TaxID=946122 RepID=A0A0C2SRV0_AMAMK|nr:hypothetical protein M378DRAFT_16808 [Amanita muscaria Koide BX008]